MKNKPTNPLSTLRHLAGTALLVLLATACQTDETPTDAHGNPLNPDGTVSISRLDVRIGEGGGEGGGQSTARVGTNEGTAQSSGQSTAPTRAADEADAKGYVDGVKTRFVTKDVLHVAIAVTKADVFSNNYQLSTATYDGTGWTLNPIIKLPQDARDTYDIQIFYDGKTTVYDRYIFDPSYSDYYTKGNFDKASFEMYYHVNNGERWPDNVPVKAKALQDANGNAYFRDGLFCIGGKSYSDASSDSGSLAITSRGTLTVGMIHMNALVRISSITNQLGSPVARAELITAPVEGSPSKFTLRGSGEVPGQTPPSATPSATPGNLPWQAVIGSGNIYECYHPTSILLTLADGRQFTIALPDPAGGNGNPDGFRPRINSVYTYRLTLLPGSFTAIPDNTGGSDGSGNLPWQPQPDPADPVPPAKND